MKCNSDPTLLKLLAELGTGFDCASVEEMRSVLSLGVDLSRIIFANPCKAASALVFARRMNVLKTTFDNLDELDAIKAFLPNAQLLLRIFVDNDGAIIKLGEKFGAPLESTRALLSRAWELGLDVVGVSFYIGSGATNPSAFRDAIQQAKIVFQQAKDIGFHMTILDVGGGFQDRNFESMAATLKEAVRTAAFPSSSVCVIAEPGRFYARTAYTLVCKVISRRRQIGETARKRREPDMLYQNDGVYGNFMNVLIEKEVMSPTLVVPRSNLNQRTRTYDDGEAGVGRKRREHRYTIWGPTCDSVDCVVRETALESEVKVGDWLKYKNMGAYTSTTATRFNGLTNDHNTIHVNSEAPPLDFY
ncbi:hypothetical protein VTN00DRAFT_7188 [Thermoascus crustaceus]|uniref:uncharacterized protein n=1 Tax=Thermoascus crustaceus TaxID=5088 RepID=UPI00374471B7